MGVFKDETETKRVIFNVRLDLAERLEAAKENARRFGKKLDTDAAVDKALEHFLKKAEKKLQDLKDKELGHVSEDGPGKDLGQPPDVVEEAGTAGLDPETADVDTRNPA
ncbi:MAG: hypothetical protein ACOCVM_08755 [Desulfovibrionaceae bacterium]